LTVTDEQLLDCMRFFATRMKLVVEPTGCLGLAALRAGKERFAGMRVGVLLTGGNIDFNLLAERLARAGR
jgi:threonine dehydratase